MLMMPILSLTMASGHTPTLPSENHHSDTLWRLLKFNIKPTEIYSFPNDSGVYVCIHLKNPTCINIYLFSSLSFFLSYIPGSITALCISYESLKPKTMESYLTLPNQMDILSKFMLPPFPVVNLP